MQKSCLSLWLHVCLEPLSYSSWFLHRKCTKPNNRVTRVKQFPEAEDCEAEDSSRAQTESDNNSQVEVDIRTEETYMTYETYICEVEKTRVE